tara:strand:- start:631 stop:1443 length:813 start_codon:yes stop_codon:yes gene_type:complete
MYIGNIPADKFQTLQKQSFTTSATDTYTLSYSVTNPQDLALFINNVRQNPNNAYTVSGTTLTLSSAITGSDTMYAVFLGRAVETIAPATGSVTNAMLAGSIDESKLAGSIPTSKITGSLGKVGQVVQAIQQDDVLINTSSEVDISGLSVSITPSATTSKVLIIWSVYYNNDSGENFRANLKRGSTAIGQGNAGTGNQCTFAFSTANMNNYWLLHSGGTFLDSPSTTSATTYKLTAAPNSGTYQMYFNRTARGGSADPLTSSTITAIEVLA